MVARIDSSNARTMGCRCGIWRPNHASMSEWFADGSGGFRAAFPLISFGIALSLSGGPSSGVGGVRAFLFEPADDVLLAGAKAAGRVQWGAVGVVGFPVQVGAGGEEALGGAALAARAGVPEPLRHLIGRGVRGIEQFLQAVEQS